MMSLTTLCAVLALVAASPSETDRALDVLTGCGDVSDTRCITAVAELKIVGDAALAPLAARIEKLAAPGQLLVLSVYADVIRPETTELLVKLAKLKKAEPEVRALAIDGLAKRRDDRVLPVANAALKDPSALVRQAAVRVLANMVTARNGKIIASLTRAAHDKSPDVRAEAAYGLGFCNCAAAGPVLREALADPSEDVKRAAAEGLSFVRDARAIAELVPLLRAEDELLKRAAGRALRFQTDADLADDPIAWERWLATQRR